MTDPTTREMLAFLKQTAGLNTRQAQHALGAGLAGPPTIDGRARRYATHRALALADAAELSDDEVWAACPRGVFIARIGQRRGFHLDQPREEQLRSVCDDWYVPLMSHIWLRLTEQPDGTYPFIATLANFVVLGATIVGSEGYGPELHSTNRNFQLTHFTLADPGPWYDDLEGRRLTLGPGYPWKLWGAPVSAPFDRTGLVDEEVISAEVARAARRRGRPRPPGWLASLPRSAPPPPGPSA